MAPPLGILDLLSKLRAQLGLDAQPQAPTDLAYAFAAATHAVVSESEDLDTPLELYMFLRGVASRHSDLKSKICNLSLDTLARLSDINGKVTHAWANLLCLDGPGLSADIVLSAVENIISAAAPEEARTQQAEQATGPASTAFSAIPNPPSTPCKRPLIVEDDTPVRANSALPYSSQTKFRTHVDPFLRAELRGTVLKDVKGFHKFFPGITETQWACAVRCPASCACPDTAFPTRRSGAPSFHIPPFPKDTSQPSVLKWFTNINKPQSSSTFYTSHNRSLTGSQGNSARKCDLFLAPTSTTIEVLTTAADVEHPWPSVLIPAELKSSPSKDTAGDTIIQLASYVREIFGAQLTRRFVHAFAICGSVLRCYLFDRAGVSISQKIDIRKNNRTQELCIRIFEAYVSMNPTQLGFDDNYEYITTNGTISSTPSLEAPNPQFFRFGGKRFKLRAIVFHRSVIVSRGTTCWEAEDMGTGEVCIIKDSWRASWRTSEGELLALAEKSGVFALPAPILHGDILVQYQGQMVADTIVQLREYLKYDDAIQVVIKLKPEDDLYSLGSSLSVVPVTIGTSNEQGSVTHARKPLSDITRETTRKRSFQTAITEEQSGKVPQKKVRKIQNRRNSRGSASGANRVLALGSTGFKKSYSTTSLPSIPELIIAATTNGIESTNGWQLAHTSECGALFQSPTSETETVEHEWALAVPIMSTANLRQGVQSAGHASVIAPLCTQAKFMDMTHSLIVSNSVGEEIKNFTSVKDLLMGMRDAIKCHQSLFERAGILHRDISPGNIMLSKYRNNDISASETPHGFLIDLDLAKYVGTSPNTPSSIPGSIRRRTGTRLFMAIDILEGTCTRHSWRHDLESFFYVFIWLCVVVPIDAYPEAQSIFERQWGGRGAASLKYKQVTKQDAYDDMMSWIPHSMKGGVVERVVWGWRGVLFPASVRDLGFITGDEGRDMKEVYKDMLAVLDKELLALQ